MLTPIVRWTVCARLLDVVGRAVDGGVEKDVRAAVAAVAAAADARDDDDAHQLSLPATGGSIPDELFSQPGALRTPASRTDTTRALVEDIDRIVTELAETMLGGWKGTPIVHGQREDPRRSIHADGKDADVSLTAHTIEDPLDIEFIHWASIAAEDFAERLCDPDATLTMRECVDHLLTPVAVALANAAARRATRRTIDGPSSSTSNENRNAWIDLPPRCAVAAADCCERVHGIATDFHREDFRKASRKKDTAVFGFGIASLTGVDIFPGGGGGSSTDVNSSREVAASSGLGAAALRKACAEGIVAAELLAAQRTSYAAAVADAAKRGITPGLTPIRSNPRPVNRDGNEKEVRYARAHDVVTRDAAARGFATRPPSVEPPRAFGGSERSVDRRAKNIVSHRISERGSVTDRSRARRGLKTRRVVRRASTSRVTTSWARAYRLTLCVVQRSVRGARVGRAEKRSSFRVEYQYSPSDE